MSHMPSPSSRLQAVKYRVRPSADTVSGPSLLELFRGEPRFSGLPHLPSAPRRLTQISVPPRPPSRSEAKKRELPSGETKGA